MQTVKVFLKRELEPVSPITRIPPNVQTKVQLKISRIRNHSDRVIRGFEWFRIFEIFKSIFEQRMVHFLKITEFVFDFKC